MVTHASGQADGAGLTSSCRRGFSGARAARTPLLLTTGETAGG
jgi:hypothetical protein